MTKRLNTVMQRNLDSISFLKLIKMKNKASDFCVTYIMYNLVEINTKAWKCQRHKFSPLYAATFQLIIHVFLLFDFRNMALDIILGFR